MHLTIRTSQHTGPPHPAQSPSTSKRFLFHPKENLSAKRIGNATSNGYDRIILRISFLEVNQDSYGGTYVDQTARLSTVGLPNGQAVNFSYYGNTGDQRLQEIKNLDPSSNMQSQFDYAYNAVGEITSWQQNNSGLAAAKTYGLNYDDANQLAGATLTVSGSSAPSASYAYGYDKVGNRTQEQAGSATTTSTYNGLNQLVGQSAGGMTHFSGKLSEWANVTVGGGAASVNSVVTTSGTSFNFDGAVNLVSGTNTVPITATDASGNTKTKNYQVVVPESSDKALTYDLLGNMTSDGMRNYVWDAANRLIKIWYGTAGSSASSEMTYDGMSRRTKIVEKDASGRVTSTKQFVWDGMGIAEEQDASNNVTKRFYGQGEQIGGASYYYTKDHLGSIREMTDSTGAIRARYDYDLWGRLTKAPYSDMDVDFAYAGYYNHLPSRLYLTAYRAYSSDLGRWISRDPVGESAGVDLYAYVSDDPINNIDPLGLANQPPFPWHPAPGTPVSCKRCDTCPIIASKCAILATMISTHMTWDFYMPDPRGGGRHAPEIADLWRAYANCQALYFAKGCGGGPPPVKLPNPVPMPTPAPSYGGSSPSIRLSGNQVLGGVVVVVIVVGAVALAGETGGLSLAALGAL